MADDITTSSSFRRITIPPNDTGYVSIFTAAWPDPIRGARATRGGAGSIDSTGSIRFPCSLRRGAARCGRESSQIENVAAILDRVKTTYNVDEDQVFLYGVSDGGTGAYYHAMRAPTIWAAFFPFIGHPSVLSNPATGVEGEMFESNLAGKAIYIVNGETDRLYSAARVLPYVEAFRQEGATVVFRARPGGHNTRWWNGESHRMEAFMNEHPRDPLPDRLAWATEDGKRFGRLHWLLIDALADGPPAGGLFTHDASFGRVVVERDGNLFNVTAHGVERYRLLLSPDDVDFAEPVKVVTNDAVSFEGPVETIVETLVTWAARDNDRKVISSSRPAAPIVATSPQASTCRMATLLWGVIPVVVEPNELDDPQALARCLARELGFGVEGQKLLLVRGFGTDPSRDTPSVAVVTI